MIRRQDRDLVGRFPRLASWLLRTCRRPARSSSALRKAVESLTAQLYNRPLLSPGHAMLEITRWSSRSSDLRFLDAKAASIRTRCNRHFRSVKLRRSDRRGREGESKPHNTSQFIALEVHDRLLVNAPAGYATMDISTLRRNAGKLPRCRRVGLRKRLRRRSNIITSDPNVQASGQYFGGIMRCDCRWRKASRAVAGKSA